MIIDIIKTNLMKENREQEPLEKFHPSQMGFCERHLFLQKIGVLWHDLNIRGSMQVGTLVHNWVENLPEIKEIADTELPIKVTNPNYSVYFEGHADIVMKDKSLLVDIKTAISLNHIRQSPMKHHLEQINIYLAGTQIENGELLYLNKADFETISHKVVYDPLLLEKTFQKANKVYLALKEWDNKGTFSKIPFEKCGCYFCNTEKIDPNFARLLE